MHYGTLTARHIGWQRQKLICTGFGKKAIDFWQENGIIIKRVAVFGGAIRRQTEYGDLSLHWKAPPFLCRDFYKKSW
jgi:hypothetical protein